MNLNPEKSTAQRKPTLKDGKYKWFEMSLSVIKAWSFFVHDHHFGSLLRFSVPFEYIILHFSSLLLKDHRQCNQLLCLLDKLTAVVLPLFLTHSVCVCVFVFTLFNMLTCHPCSALSHYQFWFGVFWITQLSSPARIPPMLTHKNISFRGNLAPFSCRLVSSPPELLCMWHIYFNCHPVLFLKSHVCYIIYMMLLLYFRPVTEKKTPLLRNHSICSGPQRFPSVLIILLSVTSISNGLALRCHSKLWVLF